MLNIKKVLQEFFDAYEDVDRVTISSSGKVHIHYVDGQSKATTPVTDAVHALLMTCPVLREEVQDGFTVVLVRGDQDGNNP